MKALREAPIAVPWLGILRADWPLVPLRYLVRFLSGGTPDKGNADFWSGGAIPWVSPKDMKVDRINDSEDHITVAALDGSSTQLVPVGSVLVVVRGMILAHTLPVAVTTGPVTINQDIKALVCGQRILPEFLHAVLAGQAEWLLSQADSSAHGTKKLETEVLQRFEVPCPPLELQRRIVATMRAQAMGLDKVVAAKQRVLDLLAEKRKTLIATAVTRGLDPKVKLRDSGVPWLGEIPSHWAAMRVRHLGTLKGGAGFPHEHQGREDEEVPFFKVKDLGDVDVLMLATDNYVSRETATALRAHIFPARTVVFAKVGAALLLNRFRLLGVPGCIDNNMMGLSLDEQRMCVEFAMSSLSLIDFKLVANPGAVPSVNEGQVSEYRLAVPPLDEQLAIVEHIARETAKLDAVRAATERTIGLLKERRSALIAAAVTGQLDVETAA